MPQPFYEQQARVRTKSLSKCSNGVGTEAWCGLNLGRAALNSMTWICAGFCLIGDSDAWSMARAIVRPVDGWGRFAPQSGGGLGGRRAPELRAERSNNCYANLK